MVSLRARREPGADRDRTARALSEVLGRRLRRLAVRALVHEIAAWDELAVQEMNFGGELELDFGTTCVFASWAENEGWSDHFSIGVQRESWFLADALHDWDLSDMPPWSACVGRTFTSARILGFRGTPHVVELRFEDAALWVADGHEGHVGDGDDLLLRAGSVPDLAGAALRWSV